jgi:hypothetical protein
MKWLLAAMAYVALAGAAFGQRNWLCVELLWSLTVLAFCYSLLAALLLRGARQAPPIGFAVLWCAYLVALFVVPTRVPSRRVLTIIGYDEPGVELLAEEYDRMAPNQFAEVYPPEAEVRFEVAEGTAPEVHASNALGAMAAGLIGCLLGALAHRHSRRDQLASR